MRMLSKRILQQHRNIICNCCIRSPWALSLSHQRLSTKSAPTKKSCRDNVGNSSCDSDGTSTSVQTSYDVIASTKKWVDTIIVGERLCPFVMPLKSSNTLRYVASNATTIDQAVMDIATQANLLLPEHVIPPSSSHTMSRRRTAGGNGDADNGSKFDIWATDDSDDEDDVVAANPKHDGTTTDDDDDDKHNVNIDDTATCNVEDSNEMEHNKCSLSSEDVEKIVDDDASTLQALDSERAMWDVLSQAQSLLDEQQDFREQKTMQLRALVTEAQKPDATFRIATSLDEIPPGMIKQHYEQVFDELEESVRHVKPALPSRPHGATLIMFDAEFVKDYIDFEDLCEAVYRKVFCDMNYYDILHIFLFHPQYVHIVYAVEKTFSAIDYVMRSPYPTMLLIREVDMKAAYLSNIIPYLRKLSKRNESHFLNQGSKICIQRLQACYVPKQSDR